MTSPRRVARDRREQYSLDELLEVVASEFLERGYDATSMEHLSQATGRTKSSIYHHVSGKEELLRLAVSRALDALFAVLDEEQAASGPAVERLEHAHDPLLTRNRTIVRSSASPAGPPVSSLALPSSR